jgi:hypothetical protein
MNKRQLIAAGVLCAVVIASVMGLLQACDHYLHGVRMKDRYGNIVRIVTLGRKDAWNDVLKNPALALLGIVCIGCYYIYELRDKK